MSRAPALIFAGASLTDPTRFQDWAVSMVSISLSSASAPTQL